ncbi:FG-GAP-like repeat-containing protein [Alcanivorax sp.]|uniref:FG-GAP-like repeat-containing protein n=1 Tax=Alcanivorax sp. TaxID=1872427 RepID=UPI003BAB2317
MTTDNNAGQFSCLFWFLVIVLVLSGCGEGGGSGKGSIGVSTNANIDTPTKPDQDTGSGGTETELDGNDATLDDWLRNAIIKNGLTGNPAAPRQRRQQTPAEDPKIKLGQLLFFSHSLSGDLTSSCATCHTPDFGGSDALSLGIGVSPIDSARIGPVRRLDINKDLDPAADGGPNMHRNSQTIFNAALFDRSLSFDGRVFVQDDDTATGGKGQEIRTPESGNFPDFSEANGLLENFVKFPLTNHNEMRAYLFSAMSQEEYREHLVSRLRGEKDKALLTPDGPENWVTHFRQAFNQPNARAEEVITLINIQRALAAYIESMIFIESPWKRYVEGNDNVISLSAKRGARLFYEPIEEGGLGCVSCHSGDFFTNENFYNTAFPQIGRGFMRAEKDDIGRWASTRREEDRYAFRVPSLLNIGVTMPYGHAGTFDLLQDVIRYHAHPRQGVENYDFSLAGLAQFQGALSYDYALSHTQKALNASSFLIAEPLLPGRELTSQEVSEITAFLRTLTDDCVRNHACRNQWTPQLDEDPDGNLLVSGVNPVAEPDLPVEPDPDENQPPAQPGDYEKKVPLSFTTSPRNTFAELEHCSEEPNQHAINAGYGFVPRHTALFGLYDPFGNPLHPHGFDAETWDLAGGLTAEPTMIAGGVSAGYLDDDCWLDLAYAGGGRSGMVFYINRGGQAGFDSQSLLDGDPGGGFTGVAMVDLNGDYRRDMLFGNIKDKKLPIYAINDHGSYYRAADLSISRHTYGISFADHNHDGYPEIFLAHWFPGNVLTAPLFWKNNGGAELEHYDFEAGLSDDTLSQNWNFSPQVGDFNGDGELDLLLASDFGTSVVMQGAGDGTFVNITDRSIITDENGMGSALGDYDNDGDLDWFVTSIYDPDGVAEANWGVTGNRLYRNNSNGGDILLENVTQEAGIADGNWGWGACFADFNNDGFLDIFHVNGFGHIPDSAVVDSKGQKIKDNAQLITEEYRGVLPKLFINQGDGMFREKAILWGLVLPSEGRGITCLDYDRDGDIDIAVLDHSRGLQFFSNQTGHGPGRRFLSVRLVGETPNTEALGAKVQLTADVGGDFGMQTQTRVSMANTNFNGQNPPDLHFGMGEADKANISVIWPDSARWQCEGINTNRFMILDQRELHPDCIVQP